MKTKKFDVSKYLDSPEAIKEYLEIMLEENGIEGFQRALGHVAKAHGMTLMVQDLTNPMLAQIPHCLLAAHVGTIMGLETNSMQFYRDAS